MYVHQKMQTLNHDINNQNHALFVKILILILNFKVEISTWFMKVGQNQYDLYMRVDTNTRGHRQWFYFSVKIKTKKFVKFNVYRFKKSYSLFQRGMKPYVRSIKSKEKWKPAGTNVKYIRQRQNNEYGVRKNSLYYYMTFQYQFQNDEDQVFFASGIPYTYSFLQQRIFLYQQQAQRLNYLKIQNINAGKSMCGLDIKILKIEHIHTASHSSQTNKKRIIAINARTHSGEASGSWVLDGILDHLSKDTQNIEWMKNYNVCFFILPMLNVDGVLTGNYRTGIVGDDFNRKFLSGRKQIFPEIFYLKKMISNAKKQGKFLMFMDLHGHSILKNSFIYGPSETDFHHCLLRKLPFYLWHKSKYFKMSSCKFKTQRDKIETARMYFQIKQNILSFTCENSLGLYGANQQTFQMNTQDWRTFGVGIVEAIQATIESEKQVVNQEKQQKEDLRQTDIPLIKQLTKPFTAPKNYQPMRDKNNYKNQIPIRKKQDDLNGIQNSFQTAVRTFSKQQQKSQKQQQPIFKSKHHQILQKNPVDIKIKLNEIRQRFPSLTSKELRNKDIISNHLKNSQKQQRGKVFSNIERNRTQEIQRKILVSKIKDQDQSLDQSDRSLFLKQQALKNQKKQFLQSIYHKKQLKSLKQKQNSQWFSLGKNEGPSAQIIRQKLEQKKNTSFLKYNSSYNSRNSSRKESLDMNQLINEQKNNYFDNIDASSKVMRMERSITYDQSYLADQIKKMIEMKQTSRQYFEQDDNIEGWGQNGKQVIFEQKFSQNFDDSVNDNDSNSQDLPQQDKKYIVNYIRTHLMVRKLKTSVLSQSDQQKIYQKQQQEQKKGISSIFNQKKIFHGFRQINFKSVCNQPQQKSLPYDLNPKLAGSYAVNTQIRKNPHKLKQSLNKIKYKSYSKKIQPEQKQDLSQIYITHKKRLNQRSLRKQSRKDPFILISIKDKFSGCKIH